MPTYHHTFTTHTPVDVAFDYLSRFSTTAEWDPGVARSRDLTPGPVTPGSAFEVVVTVLGREVPLRYEVIAYERPRIVGLRAEHAALRSTDTITFGAGDDGTTVAYDAELDLKGAARFATPLVAAAFRRIGDRAAAGLEAAVDGLAARPVEGRDNHVAPPEAAGAPEPGPGR